MLPGDYICPRAPHSVRAAGSGRAGSGGGGANRAGYRDKLLHRTAFLEGRPRTFRALTSLDIDEARRIYRQAASEAAAGPGGKKDGRRSGGGGGGGGKKAHAREFPTFEEFLMALVLVRNADECIVEAIYDVPPGAARAALDTVLPSLLKLSDMPRRFARRLVPLGYTMPPNPKRARGSGSMLDYMG